MEFRAYACHGKDKPLELWKYTPRPLGDDDVEISIQYCGICYSDIHTLDSGWGPTDYPCVVGHEIVGKVRAKGSAVHSVVVGDWVGVGAQAWACHAEQCRDCTSDQDQLCPRRVFTYNSSYEDGGKAFGGYAEAVRVSQKYAFKLPAELKPEVAAPLLCAGTTLYSPLARHGAGPGKRVGIVGIGGLGHLGVQFASKMGAETWAISHSPSKQADAATLGAKHFLNINDQAAVQAAAQTLDLVLVTSNHTGQPWQTYLSLLRNHGKCVMIALPEEPLHINVAALILNEITMTGSLIGSRKTIQDMLEFSAKHEVKPWIEVMPIAKVNEALQKVRDGKPRYRIVLETKF